MDHNDWIHLCRCSLCENPARSPRLLPCFHSFCSQCLDACIQQQQKQHQDQQQQQHQQQQQQTKSNRQDIFQCPECTTDIAIPTPGAGERTQEGVNDNGGGGDGGGSDGGGSGGGGDGDGSGGGGDGGGSGGDGGDVFESGPSKEDITPSPNSGRFQTDSFVSNLSEVVNALGPITTCQTCVRMGESHQGTHWCMDCFDTLCDRCAKSHLYGKVTASHTILPLPELHTMTLDSIMKRNTAHACHRHAPEVVKLYCLDCRCPVCVQCLSESHRQCQSCLPLETSLDREEDQVAEMMVKLGSMTFEPEDEVLEMDNGASILEDSVVKAQGAIRKMAAEVRQRIDDSEQELLNRLYSVSSQLQEKVGDFRQTPSTSTRSSDLKSLSSASNRMDALLKYGSSLEILDLFTSMKAIMSRVERSQSQSQQQDGEDDSINSSPDDEVRLKVNFEMSPSLKSFLQDFESLGDIAIEDFKSDEGRSSWGVCVTPRDSIIVVDCRAKKVQKFGISGDLIDHIQISEEPYDVTPCSDDDVAITIQKKKIFIVTVASAMSLKRRIKTQKQYEGISASSSHDTFLVGSMEERCVDVISAQGDLLKSLGGLGDGESVFDQPRYVTFSTHGQYIVSDASKNAVSCISEEGGLVFTYSPQGPHRMKGAQGVCCDASGNVFVADFGNSRVHLLTSGGEFQRFVLGRDSALSRPVAMSLSQGNKLVLVQSDGIVKIFGYESMKVKFKGTCWCPRCLASMEIKEKENSQGGRQPTRAGSGSERSSRSSRSSVSTPMTSPITKTPPRSPMMKSDGWPSQRTEFPFRSRPTSSSQQYANSPPVSPAQRKH